MMALLQRVRSARVEIGGETVGSMLCAERGDTPVLADKMLAKILKLRSDGAGKMNHCVQDIREPAWAVLVVSQFTLAADSSGGNRPGFSGAALPEDGQRLYALRDKGRVGAPAHS
jgi:D-tyrosyl-tRNA(Tyr) deacylase